MSSKTPTSDYVNADSNYLHANPTWHVEDSAWKATQILKLIQRNNLHPATVVEIGCGAGEILNQLLQRMEDKTTRFMGYEISPDAFKLAQTRQQERLHFFQHDLLQTNDHYDLLLMIDVFEHVDDYLGFVKKAGEKATYKIYHIPLDMSAFSVLTNYPAGARRNVGHLHYFMKDTALATLTDAGQEVLDWFYTPGAFERNNKGLTFGGKIVQLFRRITYKIKPDLAVKAFGGFSLIVLTR
ncbi:MAG TPA: class I SAM-dependent methyltransferase [Ferruginibacter sp.]|jgi:SAM-dependent methyltransferase|nr:class I SAM-dependent methyltransferase [Ferruginibacter sp.]